MTGDSDSQAGPAAKAKPLSRRAAARLAAVQTLYQIDLTGQTPARAMADFLAHRLEGNEEQPDLAALDRALFEALVEGVTKNREALDDMLSAVLAADWPVERLDRVLRLILRSGAHELEHFADTPSKVVITEYVALADDFFAGKEPAMANGVLDRLARVLRPEEFPDADDALSPERWS